MKSSRTVIRHALVMMLGFAAGLSVARASDAVSLKARHADGERYFEVDTETDQKITGPDGKPMEVKSRSVYGLVAKETRKGSGLEMELTLDRCLGFSAFSESMKSLYDTDDPDYEDASPMHRDTFGPIMGMGLKITLDEKGVASGVEGSEAIRKKLKDMGDQNFVAKSLTEIDFSDGQIKSNFAEKPLALFPQKDVKRGESWTATCSDEYPQVGKIFVKYECKLDSADAKTATVSFKGTMTKDESEKPAKDQRLGKIDGSFSGTAKIDLAQGRVVEMQREMKVKSEVQPWWTKELTAPLMKVDEQTTQKYAVMSIEGRKAKKAEIARGMAEAKARREAEEAAAMAGPIDPVTAENEPVAWTQWGGPKRDFRSPATGLANRWPKSGPPKLWERNLGDGFSTILCEGDVLYTTYSARDKADAYKGDEVVVALDARTGKTKWEYKYAAPWPKELQMEFGAGPYSTPIIVGDKLFSVGITAKLVCLDKRNGKLLWSKDLHEEYKAGLSMRGYGSSPLAYNGKLVMTISKEKGQAVMAFNMEDGSQAWKGGEFNPGYASLLPISLGDTEQIVAFSTKSVLGLDPRDASTKWSVDHPTQWGGNISTPVWGEDGNLLSRRPMGWARGASRWRSRAARLSRRRPGLIRR